MKNVFLCVLFIFNTCYGQDSSSFQKFLKDFDFDVTGGGYFQKPISSGIILPGYLKSARTISNNTFNPAWKNATDNPLYHGAYFLTFNTKYRINKNISMWASLIAEDRGFSYGVNNTNNTTVFPQIKVDINKDILFLRDTLQLFGSIGNQINPRLYEGLTIYNLYQHGIDLHVKWNHFQLRYYRIADLINGIGLRIDDSHDYIGSYETKVNKNWLMNIQSGYSFYPYYDFPYRNIFNFSIGFNQSSKMRLYAQASYRPNNTVYFKNKEMLAGVAGIYWKIINKQLRVESTLEGRYYGAGFNANFINTNVLYRDPYKSLFYGNTIGENLYPLMLYDRPFSQWAVFTEYQFKNVEAAVWQFNSSYFAYKNFIIKADLDFNYIFTEHESPFLYPFYNIGFGWQEGNNLIMAGMTNKGMNLDVHYPTFYLYTDPVFMITMKRSLSENWFEMKN